MSRSRQLESTQNHCQCASSPRQGAVFQGGIYAVMRTSKYLRHAYGKCAAPQGDV